jgi:hypothetical protein
MAGAGRVQVMPDRDQGGDGGLSRFIVDCHGWRARVLLLAPFTSSPGSAYSWSYLQPIRKDLLGHRSRRLAFFGSERVGSLSFGRGWFGDGHENDGVGWLCSL